MGLPPSSPSQSLITDRSGAVENLYDTQLSRHFDFRIFEFYLIGVRDLTAFFCTDTGFKLLPNSLTGIF